MSSPLAPSNNNKAEEDSNNNNNIAAAAATTSGCKRRRVQISEAVSVCAQPGAGTLTEEELSESWWSAKEFAEGKKMAKIMCQQSRRARRYSDCLSGAYEKACSLVGKQQQQQQQQNNNDDDIPPAAQPLEEEESSGEFSVPDSVDEGLLRLVQQEQGPRGLEGYSSRLHAMRRARHLKDSKHAVFLEQARQNISNQRDEEQLARQAMMASSAARTFATMLGQADALAAARDNYYNNNNNSTNSSSNATATARGRPTAQDTTRTTEVNHSRLSACSSDQALDTQVTLSAE